MREPLLCFIFLFLALFSSGQNYRSPDGYGNNLQNPDWGSANTPFVSLLKPHFADGFSLPAGENRTSPRFISQLSFWDRKANPYSSHLSTYAAAWAQFIHNDICNELYSEKEFVEIPLEESDPHFGLHALAGYNLSFARTQPIENTGTSPLNFRRYANTSTTWIDGSQIYGIQPQRSEWIRTFQQGKLKTSLYHQLPMNTLTGYFEDAIDPAAPEMLNPRSGNRKYFVAGSPKANENLQQLGLHTLFLREHNRICDSLYSNGVYATDEEIYQKARALVIAQIQKITFEEWLPSLGIELPKYQEYNPLINPSLLEYYAAAASQITHTSLPKEVSLVSEQKGIEALPYLYTYYNPLVFSLHKSYEKILMGMAIQPQNPIDPYLPFELRNFFDNDFVHPIYDYWTASVIKGRERGLPDYNSMRLSLGLPYIHSFYQVTRNGDLAFHLFANYLDMSDVDPWIGLLAEDPEEGKVMGPTLSTLYLNTFLALRNGDRFYYEMDPLLSEEDIAFVKNTRLSDLILRNSKIQGIPKDVFRATPIEKWPNHLVSISRATFDALAYPNPCEQELNLRIFYPHIPQGKVSLRLMNSSGTVLWEDKYPLLQGLHPYTPPPVSSLPKGLYWLQCSTDQDSKTLKILKL
jgi:hypothetical protein